MSASHVEDSKFNPNLVFMSPCDATLPARPAVLRKEQHEVIRNVLNSGQHQSGAALRHVEKGARHEGPILAIGDPDAVACVSSDTTSFLAGYSETLF
jgi:hypothetical protein